MTAKSIPKGILFRIPPLDANETEFTKSAQVLNLCHEYEFAKKVCPTTALPPFYGSIFTDALQVKGPIKYYRTVLQKI